LFSPWTRTFATVAALTVAALTAPTSDPKEESRTANGERGGVGQDPCSSAGGSPTMSYETASIPGPLFTVRPCALYGICTVSPSVVPGSASGAPAIPLRRALQEKEHYLSPLPPPLSLHTTWQSEMLFLTMPQSHSSEVCRTSARRALWLARAGRSDRSRFANDLPSFRTPPRHPKHFLNASIIR
jgi:hypothetical protein